MNQQALDELAYELVDSFINGNRSHVVDELAALSPVRAAYVAACMLTDAGPAAAADVRNALAARLDVRLDVRTEEPAECACCCAEWPRCGCALFD